MICLDPHRGKMIYLSQGPKCVCMHAHVHVLNIYNVQ